MLSPRKGYRKPNIRELYEIYPFEMKWVVLPVGILVALVVVLFVLRISYALDWTGFGPSKVKGDFQPSKTLWDWLDLLIVPLVLAIGGYLFTRSENRATQAAAERRAQDEALQAYLDQIGQLLLDTERPLRQSREGDEVRTLARARTLTVMARLDGDRKGSAMQFLYESSLITRVAGIVDLTGADLREADLREADLSGADLRDADLREADLSGADLSGAILTLAILSGADLSGTILSGTGLWGTILSGADLSGANLSGANSREAVLSGADLSGADLREADLRDADLREAVLSGAVLSGAVLSGADLSGAEGWTDEQFRAARVFDGATMPDRQTLRGFKTPNGPTFEAWLKDKKGSRKDEENSGPS